MNIYFQYNSKSSGQNVPLANEIARELGFERRERYNVVEFDDPADPGLRRLYDLVGNLKGSRIFLDEDTTLSPRRLFETVACPERVTCDGLCSHVRFGKMTLTRLIDRYGRFTQEEELTIYGDDLIEALAPFLEEEGDGTLSLNKDLLLEAFKEGASSERLFCAKYDKNLLLSEVAKLPGTLHYRPVSKLEQAFSDAHVPREMDLLRTVVAHSSLDDELTPSERVQAVDALRLIERRRMPVGESGAWLSSSPYEDVAVTWTLVPKDVSEEGAVAAKVVKEDGAFVLDCPFFELRFCVSSKEEAALRNAFEGLMG